MNFRRREKGLCFRYQPAISRYQPLSAAISHGREAGARTYGAVALGACVFALISTHVTGGNNPHVIAAGVVTGIGFVGAGVILREQGSVVGLTTAATLWSTASVGLAIGYGMYILGTLVSVLIFGLLALHHLPYRRSRTPKR